MAPIGTPEPLKQSLSYPLISYLTSTAMSTCDYNHDFYAQPNELKKLNDRVHHKKTFGF